MEVDRDFLQNMVYMLDSLIGMTRDKLIWQSLAIPFLGAEWREKFQQAHDDPYFLKDGEVFVADIRRMRDVLVAMLDQLQKGESPQPPIDRIN